MHARVRIVDDMVHTQKQHIADDMGWSSTHVCTIPPRFPLALSLVSVTGCPPAPRPSLFSKEKELFQIAHI